VVAITASVPATSWPLLRSESRPFLARPARAGKVGRAVGGFLKGQLLVAFTVGVLSAFGFWIIGLPFWLVFGAIAGFFNLVPLVGPFIGGGIGFLVGTLSDGVSLGLKAALVELLVQQLESHILQPLLLGHAVSLHPVAVLLSVAAGSVIGGIVGALLAVPFVATLNTVLLYLHGKDKFPELGRDPDALTSRKAGMEGR
jgi:predicted PurR-regulated permease PerM